MDPVGSGLQANVDPHGAYSFPAPLRASPQSLWDDNRANFFRDPRASRVGDVLTVTIAINDNAQDGIDISWLWDVDFDRFREESVKSITVSGIRCQDMRLRMK